MWDNVKIINNKHFVAVYDGNQLIHHGTRPIDRVFADNVRKKMVAMEYIPQESKDETKFIKAGG